MLECFKTAAPFFCQMAVSSEKLLSSIEQKQTENP